MLYDVVEMRHLAASRATQAALEQVAAGLRLEMMMRPGARARFAAAVAADPGFGYAHAGLAVLDFLAGGTGTSRAAGHLSAAEAAMDRATGPERATIELAGRCLRLPAAERAGRVAAHLAGHPTDILAIILGVASVDRGRHGPAAVVDLLEPVLPAHRGHWFVPGLLATWLVEAGRILPASRLAEAALAVEPGAWHAAHARGHLAYATDEHAPGADWLAGWSARHDPRGYARAHLAWHVAVGRLATGDAGAATATMLAVFGPDSPQAGVDLVEFATAGWLCRLAGDPALAGRLRAALDTGAAAAGRDRPAGALATVAQGLLLAGADRRRQLADLVAWAARRTDEVYGRVVSPVLRACADLAGGDPAAAYRRVAGVDRVALDRLGGSVLERDAVERCLLFALRATATL